MQSVTLPGILQTEDYARVLFSGARPKLPPDEVELRVEHRLKRAAIFDRKNPPQFSAILHEAALRMRFGGRKIARNQLEYLIEMSRRPSITVRVIPFTNEARLHVQQFHQFLLVAAADGAGCGSQHVGRWVRPVCTESCRHAESESRSVIRGQRDSRTFPRLPQRIRSPYSPSACPARPPVPQGDHAAPHPASEALGPLTGPEGFRNGPRSQAQLQVPLPESLYCSAVVSKPGPGRTGL
jgi:uncharacterized protein DUF5753